MLYRSLLQQSPVVLVPLLPLPLLASPIAQPAASEWFIDEIVEQKGSVDEEDESSDLEPLE